MNLQLHQTMNYLKTNHTNSVCLKPDDIIVAAPVKVSSSHRRGRNHQYLHELKTQKTGIEGLMKQEI
jgi:hypothetical protein